MVMLNDSDDYKGSSNDILFDAGPYYVMASFKIGISNSESFDITFN